MSRRSSPSFPPRPRQTPRSGDDRSRDALDPGELGKGYEAESYKKRLGVLSFKVCCVQRERKLRKDLRTPEDFYESYRDQKELYLRSLVIN